VAFAARPISGEARERASCVAELVRIARSRCKPSKRPVGCPAREELSAGEREREREGVERRETERGERMSEFKREKERAGARGR